MLKLYQIHWRGQIGFSYCPVISFVLASTDEEAKRLLQDREGQPECIIDDLQELSLEQPRIIHDDYEW